MDFGVFIPIANDGWIMTETSPKYRPTFELNSEMGQRFTGEFCDYNFTHAGGPEGLKEINDQLEAEAKKAGWAGEIHNHPLYMVIMDDTDELAQARGQAQGRHRLRRQSLREGPGRQGRQVRGPRSTERVFCCDGRNMTLSLLFTSPR
jgi:alkanesulfonate monooxygenase SsuD/methylene tetrahydromethanopterin reductase-like flavin-dependent oxidoreductase (luciferase family)